MRCWSILVLWILLWETNNNKSGIVVEGHRHLFDTATRFSNKSSLGNSSSDSNHSNKSNNFWERRRQQPSLSSISPSIIVKQLAAGGVSRSVAQMVLYPIDAMRTLKQTRDGRTLRDVGMKALVRGCTTTSFFALFIGSIQFTVYEGCRDVLKTGPLLASAAGAACSCIVSVPQEVIKQRLIVGVYTNFGQAVHSIYTQEGLKGFYNSWKPTMARNVPFVMTTFLTMDAMKNRLLQYKRNQNGNGGEELAVIIIIIIIDSR